MHNKNMPFLCDFIYDSVRLDSKSVIYYTKYKLPNYMTTAIARVHLVHLINAN